MRIDDMRLAPDAFEPGFAVLISASLLGGCSALSLLDTPGHNHMSLANSSDYNVLLPPDGRTLRVSLDRNSAVTKRVVWAISFGTAEGPPSSEFDTAAGYWWQFEQPGCKPADQQAPVGFGGSEYDVICEATQAAR